MNRRILFCLLLLLGLFPACDDGTTPVLPEVDAGVVALPPDASCTPRSCGELDKNCGDVDDGCGGQLDCGPCVAPQTCGGGGVTNVCGCIRKHCDPARRNCGTLDDGCGGAAECGGCQAGESCGGTGVANVCGAGTCTPKTCTELGKNCGSVSDGCSLQLSCGACAAPQTCGGSGVANVCGCPGETDARICIRLGKNCGPLTAPDSCGVTRTLNCGACAGQQTCGGGGVANVCGGCEPKTCLGLGATCGAPSDGCGKTLGCGTCSAPETCGGGGLANVCGSGCVAKSCGELGASCGAPSNGCGGTLSCGTCALPLTCGGGGLPFTCGTGCAPRTCADLSANCGNPSDGCGGSLSCGDCPANQSCGGAGVPFVCGSGCAPRTCQTTGANCGKPPDGCGGDLSCGTCTAPQSCGGAGVPYVCGTACTPKTCGDLGANCGAPSDGCGRALSCGTCTAPQTCGGGGAANVCGAACLVTCPTGYSCDATGTCGGGDVTTLIFDVPVPPRHNVSGTITVNGAPPNQSCSAGNTYSRAVLTFKHLARSEFNTTITVPACTVAGTSFGFNGPLYPGNYEVTVEKGESPSTNLPDWPTVVATSFSVTGPMTGVVFDVPVPPLHLVAGTITVNGAPPSQSCAAGNTYSRAVLTFKHLTIPRFDATIAIPACTVVGAPFAFTGQVYPGTYRVTVEKGESPSTNLPDWPTVVSTGLSVAGDLNGLVFDVPIPPLHPISGTITLNGALPAQSCAAGNTYSRAAVILKNLTDPKFSAELTVPACTVAGSAFTFSGEVYPGSYEVTVTRGESPSTNLPSWPVVVTSLSVSGPMSGLVFDVVVPPLHPISGLITVNGAPPAQNCAAGNTLSRAVLGFKHLTDAKFSATITIPACTVAGAPFDFSGQLYPGAYEVTVNQGESPSTNLPSWPTVVRASLPVSGPASGLVFDVVVPSQHAVSGTITVNGAAPTQNCAAGNTLSRAVLSFKHLTDAKFSATITIPACTVAGAPFAFSGQLYPGAYEVTATKGESPSTNLPTWPTIVASSQAVSGPLSNLVYDVPIPPLHTVSGTITVNGAAPTQSCAAGNTLSRAVLTFKHLTDAKFSATITIPACTVAGAPFGFTGQLYPGVYEVTVVHGESQSTNLPTWPTVVVARLRVP